MRLTCYIFAQTSATPYCISMDSEDFIGSMSGLQPYVTDVDGKWYLEYDLPESTVRIVDIDEKRLNRQLEPLCEELYTHLGITDPATRTLKKTGVKLKLCHLGPLREVITYVDREMLERELVFNGWDKKFSLLRFDTRDYYSIYTVDNQEPTWDQASVPYQHIAVSFSMRTFRED